MPASPLLLPHGIADLMRSLAWRVKTALVLRGVSLVILVLGVGFGLICQIDVWIGYTSSGLRLAALAWVLSSLGVLIWQVAIPLFSRPDPYVLALLVEQDFPDLQERLSATVALAQDREAAHGAEALIALLGEEADKCCRVVRPADVIPFQSVRKWLVGAGLVLALTIVPAALVDDYRFFSRRFVAAWFNPVPGFRLGVSPGDSAVAIGDSLTLSAHWVDREVGARIPDNWHVTYTTGSQPALRKRMAPSGFHLQQLILQSINDDVTYYVEAGEFRSPKFLVKAVVPVEIEQGTMEASPPPYVNAKVLPGSTQTIRPVVHRYKIDAGLSSGKSQPILQYSKVRCVWRLTRPALNGEAYLNSETLLRLQWSADRRQAEVEFTLDKIGTTKLNLKLEAEDGIASYRENSSLEVFADAPPVFTNKVGAMSAKEVLPNDILRLRIRSEDNVGLDRLELEYRINDGAVQTHLLAKADGQQAIAGEFPFPLKAKVKEGDLFQFRFKATDNRDLPSVGLGPQVTFDPALKDGKDEWLMLRIASKARPLQEQVIAAQHDELMRRLADIKKKVEQAQAQVKQVKSAGHAQSFLPASALEKLSQTRKLNRDIVKDLGQFAGQALGVSGLLAELALDVADAELGRVEQSLADAEAKHRQPAFRDRSLDQAEADLIRAKKKLDALADASARFAQDRLDQAQLQRLADLQEELARRAAELTNKEDLERLRAEQDRVAEQLQQLTRKSQLFQEAMQQHQNMLVQRLAQQARDLAQRLMKLGEPKDMAGDAAKLAEELMRLGLQEGDPKKMTGAKEAAHAAMEAKATLDKAGKENDKAKAMDAAKEAVLKLEMAAKKTEELAKDLPKLMGKDDDETGKALNQARMELDKARDDLRKNDSAKAQPTMKQAAKTMQQAAQASAHQLAKGQRLAGPPGVLTNPRPSIGQAGPVSGMALQEVLGKFNGQAWGELPGEVKNRIVQDWQARYGADFAQVVRRYFEQLAAER